MVESYVSKRSQEIVETTRRIYTKTIRQIHQIVKNRSGVDILIGSVYNFKPFYIEKPTEREKESCLCVFCLNIRLRFNELQKHLKNNEKKVNSMSEYFANGITCKRGANGFYCLACISTECEQDECKITPMFIDNDFNIPKMVKFDQFVRDEYSYTSKHGVKKTGLRTIRKQFVDGFKEFKDHLDCKGALYLLHMFECVNDNFIWPQILDNSVRLYLSYGLFRKRELFAKV